MEKRQEEVGDVIRGTPFVDASWQPMKKGDLYVLDKAKPLRLGGGRYITWRAKEKMAGGWSREVEHRLDMDATDEARADALYEVIEVSKEPSSDPGPMGRDAGYGGGINVVIRRLGDDGARDLAGETISYGRGNCYNTDIHGPVEFVRSMSDEDMKSAQMQADTDILVGALAKAKDRGMDLPDALVVLCEAYGLLGPTVSWEIDSNTYGESAMRVTIDAIMGKF